MLLVVSTNCFAVTPLLLNKSPHSYDLSSNLFYFEDVDQSFDINKISSSKMASQFKPLNAQSPNFGFTESAYWFRFTLIDPSDRENPWILELTNAMINFVDFYIPKPDGGFLVKKSGDGLAFDTRDMMYRNVNFLLRPSQSLSSTYYLRVVTGPPMQFGLHLHDPLSFHANALQGDFALGIYYGIMIVMLIYNISLLVVFKDRAYFDYCLYIIGSIIGFLVFDGLAFQYLWPDKPGANARLLYVMSFMAMCAVQFSRSFLSTAKLTPKMDKILWVLMILPLFAIVNFGNMGIALGAQFMLVVGALASGVITISAFLCVLKGYRPAKFYIIAWSFFIVGSLIYMLKMVTLLPENFITSWGIQIGSSIEVIVLSFAMADRIQIMKDEREEAMRKQLIESQKVVGLSNTFKKFVPYEFLDFLDKKSITDVRIGNHVEKEMSILFSDIRSFTSLSEGMSPDDNFHFLNAYLSRMGPVVREHNGFVDKYIGDAVMALFDGEADDAVNAAINMLKVLQEYNQIRATKKNRPLIEIGIGINTGELMLGIIGEHNRMESTVISDAVNLAARVEGMTKKYGASILISGQTFHQLSDPSRYSMRLIDQVIAKGKSEPVTIWEVFDGDPTDVREKKLSTIKPFEQGISLFALNQVQAAQEMFEACLKVYPEDKAAKFYVNRCQQALAVSDEDESTVLMWHDQ